jgi:hypothetical protein
VRNRVTAHQRTASPWFAPVSEHRILTVIVAIGWFSYNRLGPGTTFSTAIGGVLAPVPCS